ncbi:hypothetical protein BDK51DRAFT_48513 [Blyttiomyces helicus]|uniref:Uncharacterized protein n=1 Tax=Blyttiomyces helicus TaxID=388810 RepID=A0A4P9VYQ8_9FUNG|nr:hypothetical protein BDK51DRAFT_48513 [Blyttiomyces helicus]|eukprot:RKO84931.1 hypothetical protein BDK51DRAFT_48513 [Blyttiomyces helicus]
MPAPHWFNKSIGIGWTDTCKLTVRNEAAVEGCGHYWHITLLSACSTWPRSDGVLQPQGYASDIILLSVGTMDYEETALLSSFPSPRSSLASALSSLGAKKKRDETKAGRRRRLPIPSREAPNAPWTETAYYPLTFYGTAVARPTAAQEVLLNEHLDQFIKEISPTDPNRTDREGVIAEDTRATCTNMDMAVQDATLDESPNQQVTKTHLASRCSRLLENNDPQS